MGRRSAAAMAMAALGLGGGPAWAAESPSAGELLQQLHGLRVVGSVLYVAAHPDDENTRLLAWLEGERHLDSTYLSLTRGGGGQNLIGTEQAELLGVVRTGELLAARGVDGASQRFTRARDFGYSKSADEALRMWGHDEVLDDVVRAMRTVRPDVVITRFGPTDQTHGHHVASAVLAEEAFRLAGDPAYATEGLSPWQPARLVRNQSHWRIDEDTDTSGWLSVDVGGYSAALGRSWTELAAASRTMHKSQGFGSSPSVGPQLEYLSAVAGDVPSPGHDPFDGLVLDWSRYPQAKALDRTLAKAIRTFDPMHPEAILPLLATAHAQLSALDADGWEQAKRAELEAVMASCAGLWLTARTPDPAVVPGTPLAVELQALVRTGAEVQLAGVSVGDTDLSVGEALATHATWEASAEVDTAGVPLSVPHWLAESPTPTRYTIPAGDGRTAADTEPPLSARFSLRIAGAPVELSVPVEHAWTDPVHGERRHPVEVLPAATASFGQRARLVPRGAPVTVPLTLRASAGAVQGTLHLTAPDGTEIDQPERPFSLTEEAPELTLAVQLTPGSTAGPLRAELAIDGERTAYSRSVIDHPHLSPRTVLQPAELSVVPVDLDRGGVDRIAYLPGSGDTVAEGLRDLGYRVDLVDLDTVRTGGLADYPTVLVGIRAFNTQPELLDAQSTLYDYVAGGGRLVIQYQTSNRWRDLGDLGPEPFHIGRGRVTDETAPLVAVDPDHGVLHHPNRLTDADQAGWVQERGLYFADRWSPAYQTVFRAHDAGEEPLEGSVLVLAHGEGTLVYTGLSFFRQLPAGVPGAARLLANLLAHDAGQEAESHE